MPVDPNAAVSVSAYDWVPPFAQGLVRDLRVRWALEEAGIPYTVRLLNPRAARPADYLAEQPFGQVPAYSDEGTSLFESGAIVLHIGEGCEALLPRDRQRRATATQWLLAALNTVEPPIQQLAALDFFYKDQPWTRDARPLTLENVTKRLGQLAAALGDREWLDGDFTAGDLMMVTVLRILRRTELVHEHENLAAYQARGEARPAFKRALDAQMADFRDEPAAA